MSPSPDPHSPLGRRSGLPLPKHRYVPGLTARHPEGAFDRVRDMADAETSSQTAAQNTAWLHGLDLLEAGFYWEAHEVLEQVWMNAGPQTPERAMVQAVIQLANAALKHGMARPNAVLRLCAIAEDHLHAAALTGAADIMGLTPTDLQSQINRVRYAREDRGEVKLSLEIE